MATNQEKSRPSADLRPESQSANDIDVPDGEFKAKTIVVVGSGFAGYFAARRLARKLDPKEATVTIITDGDGFLYQPLLPEVAVGALDPRAIVVPLVSSLPGVRLVRGRAQGIDPSARSVAVSNEAAGDFTVSYDRLVLAAGSVTRMFDIPGLAEHALGLKTTGEALYIRDLFLRRLEQAGDQADPAARRRLLSFVVVGAGYSGVELVAQLSHLSEQLLPRYPNVEPTDVNWLLIDVSPAVLPQLGAPLGDHTMTVLRKRGVDVRLGVSIKEVTEDAVTLTDETTLDGAVVVWCAGVAPSPLAASLGLPTTKGRLVVGADLRAPESPEVYAIGDVAAIPNLRGERGKDGSFPLCPPTAQHAMRQGHAVAKNVAADLRGQTLRPYRHYDLGLVVDLGGPDAVARPLGVQLKGRLAKLVTRGYHVFALPTVRRRIRVLLDWAMTGRSPDGLSLGLLEAPSGLASQEHTDSREHTH